MKIAVLDDNLTDGEMLQQGLELAGHTVVVYASPSTFFVDIKVVDPKTALTPFDLILVDPHPSEGISGGEVIPKILK